MLSIDQIFNNLISPFVIAFYLGILATYFRSNLKLPESLYTAMSLYLLIALGIKGGEGLAKASLHSVVFPIIGVFILGILCPLIAYFFARYWIRLKRIDAAALSAHYGSVSIVTFMMVQVFLDSQGVKYEGFMAALVTMLEVPGIVVALLLAEREQLQEQAKLKIDRDPFLVRVGKIITSKSIFVLLGGLAIGAICGPQGIKSIKPFFSDLFLGVLMLFMIDMGTIAGSHLRELKQVGVRLIVYAIVLPLILSFFGAVAGLICGLSLGGATIMATICASASYIAAPAAVRLSLPSANPVYYLASSLVVTFPFNLTFGIPLYYELAKWLTHFIG